MLIRLGRGKESLLIYGLVVNALMDCFQNVNNQLVVE